MTISALRPAPVPASIPATPYDAWAPDLQLLLGAAAEGPLSSLIETADGELLSFRPRQVNHQPPPAGLARGGTSSTVVQYAAQVRWAGGRVANETLVMATGGQSLTGLPSSRVTAYESESGVGPSIRICLAWRAPSTQPP